MLNVIIVPGTCCLCGIDDVRGGSRDGAKVNDGDDAGEELIGKHDDHEEKASIRFG